MADLSDSPRLIWNNRRIIARDWPPGVLSTCEWLDMQYPGWSVWWHAECTVPGLKHPAGYVADRLGDGSVVVCGESVPELEAAIAGAPEEVHEWWKRDKCCARQWHR